MFTQRLAIRTYQLLPVVSCVCVNPALEFFRAYFVFIVTQDNILADPATIGSSIGQYDKIDLVPV